MTKEPTTSEPPDEWRTIKEFLDETAEKGWMRARELYDTFTKQLIWVCAGGIVVTLGLAGSLTKQTNPSSFAPAAFLFGAGIALALVAIFFSYRGIGKRADKASEIRSNLRKGNLKNDDAINEWNSFQKSERRWLAFVPLYFGFGCFVAGMVFGILALDGIEDVTPPSPTLALLNESQ